MLKLFSQGITSQVTLFGRWPGLVRVCLPIRFGVCPWKCLWLPRECACHVIVSPDWALWLTWGLALSNRIRFNGAELSILSRCLLIIASTSLRIGFSRNYSCLLITNNQRDCVVTTITFLGKVWKQKNSCVSYLIIKPHDYYYVCLLLNNIAYVQR